MNRLPLIIAIVLLLLPVLYVGSYLALVVPGGIYLDGMSNGLRASVSGNYRYGASWAWRFYWPLEQIDRKVRPKAWRSAWEDAPNRWYSGPRPI